MWQSNDLDEGPAISGEVDRVPVTENVCSATGVEDYPREIRDSASRNGAAAIQTSHPDSLDQDTREAVNEAAVCRASTGPEGKSGVTNCTGGEKYVDAGQNDPPTVTRREFGDNCARSAALTETAEKSETEKPSLRDGDTRRCASCVETPDGSRNSVASERPSGTPRGMACEANREARENETKGSSPAVVCVRKDRKQKERGNAGKIMFHSPPKSIFKPTAQVSGRGSITDWQRQRGNGWSNRVRLEKVVLSRLKKPHVIWAPSDHAHTNDVAHTRTTPPPFFLRLPSTIQYHPPPFWLVGRLHLWKKNYLNWHFIPSPKSAFILVTLTFSIHILFFRQGCVCEGGGEGERVSNLKQQWVLPTQFIHRWGEKLAESDPRSFLPLLSGDRGLQHDPGRRPRAGVPVRRQGLALLTPHAATVPVPRQGQGESRGQVTCSIMTNHKLTCFNLALRDE